MMRTKKVMSHSASGNKMDPKFKKRWVSWLRKSPDEGGYRQGRHRLVDDQNRFCCLGVAANLLMSRGEELGIEWHLNTDEEWVLTLGRHYNQWEGTLPMSVLDHIRLDTDDESTLTVLNDDGASFAQIADWIEKNL